MRQDDIDNAVDDGYTIEDVMTTEGAFVASTLIDREWVKSYYEVHAPSCVVYLRGNF